MRRRPVQPKVAILHEHVGGHRGAAVTGRYHRRVVARAYQYLARLATAPHQPIDDGEFSELLQRRGLSHRASV